MSFLHNIYSLPESARKKILVVWVGISMILVSFIWFSSTKSKLAATEQSTIDSQMKDAQQNILNSIDATKLQSSMYETSLENKIKRLEENKQNTNNPNTDNLEEENTEYVEDETELEGDSILFGEEEITHN